jgi:hypothetical protein
MTKLPTSARPPRLAAWLVDLFASPDQAESILGALSEEFSDITSQSEVVSARRWYWRQSVKTVFHLAGTAFRPAPWSLAGSVLLGFFLRWFSSGLPERVVVAILRTQRPYSNLHYNAYVWLITYGIPSVHVIASIFVGCIVALAAKRREMVATMSLVLVLCALTGVSSVWLASRNAPILWGMFPWYFADWFAIVLGGIIVREIRSAATRRSAT